MEEGRLDSTRGKYYMQYYFLPGPWYSDEYRMDLRAVLYSIGHSYISNRMVGRTLILLACSSAIRKHFVADNPNHAPHQTIDFSLSLQRRSRSAG